MKTKLLGLLAGIGICALAVQPAAAASISLSTSRSGFDGPLSASADFTTSAGLLSVTITNGLSPTQIVSAGQTVSDLIFTLSNAPGTLGTTSASGQLANIGAGGSVTNVSGDPLWWLGLGPPPPGGQGTFSIAGNTVTLEAIGGGQPSQMILPNGSTFAAANASITNGKFSPYVDGSATFVLALSGVTSATTVTGATFSFGTGPDTFIQTGSNPPPPPPPPIPLPGALPLFATGLAGLGLLGWRRKRNAQAA